MNTGLPTAQPWSGTQGIPSGESRAHLSVQAQQRQLSKAESAVAQHLGSAGIGMEAAARLAVIVIELRGQVEYLQTRVRELAGE